LKKYQNKIYDVNFDDTHDVYYEKFSKNLPFVSQHADQRPVKATKRNIEISLKKCDKQKIHPDMSDKEYSWAKKLWEEYLTPILTTEPLKTGDKIILNLDKSSGLPYTLFGASKKERCNKNRNF